MKRSISAWRRTHSPGSSAEWRRARLSSQQQDRFHLLPRSLAGDFDRTSAPSQSSSTPRGSSSLMLCCGGRRWRSGSWRPTRMSSRTRSGIQCKSLSSRTRSGIQCHALTGLRIRSAMTGRNKLRPDSNLSCRTPKLSSRAPRLSSRAPRLSSRARPGIQEVRGHGLRIRSAMTTLKAL